MPGQTADQPAPAEFKTLPRRFISDEWRIWSSPFRKESYASGAALKYVLPFTLLSGALIATDHKTAHVLPNSTDQAVWSGRVSQFGASYTLAGVSGATYLLGKLVRNEHFQETGLLAMEALAHTQVVVFTIKQASNRERPLDYSGRAGFWGGGNSFSSGHAASAFAVASVFAYEYGDRIAVPITAYALAGVVSASRVGAQRHWVSDVVVGGSLGFLIGRFSYKRHHDPRLSADPNSRGKRFVPQVGISGSTVGLTWRL